MDDVLRVEHIVKTYPGVKAVSDVSFSLKRGEVLALLGENGAGKSTITKIICGAVKPDSGTVYIEGEPQDFSSPSEAMAKGVGMVYQELSMVGNMSVAENIFMNRQPVSKSGAIRWKQLYAETNELLRKFEIDVDPGTLVKNLSVGTCQLLEILKAISMKPRVIILDEPTSSLTETETELMFKTVRMLKREGVSFIYISHKLSEIFALADCAVVMRDGQYIGRKNVAETTENEIVTMMVGREIKDVYGEAGKPLDTKEPLYFEVKNLTCSGMYENVSFGVRKGEILGISGLIGADRTELALGVIGAHRTDKGEVLLNGKKIQIHSPSDAIANKIAYLTEDRKGLGLYLNLPIKANLVAAMLRKFAPKGLMRESLIQKNAKQQKEKYSIATPSVQQTVGNLSGGNQQKVLIAMWMGIDPDVIIFDEPTRGVDVGAKAEIYQIIKQYARQGKCVIIISSEMPELIGMSDEILIMHNGRVNGLIKRAEFSEDNIIKYVTGIQKQEEYKE